MPGKTELICPNCSSDNVSKPRYSMAAMAIAILLVGFPIPFLSKTYHCFDCGLNFKVEKPGDNENSSTPPL